MQVILIASLVPLAANPASADHGTFVVNSTGDESDSNVGDGICDVGDGICTLRAAIEEANAHSGADSIQFEIGESGPATISVTTVLPQITEQVSIDGTTQPGYVATPLIHVSGPGSGSGLRISARLSVVAGLAITGFGNAVQFDGAGESQVRDSFIGTADGITAGSNFRGVRVSSSANLIGPNNVISGNQTEGVQIIGSGATGNQVFSNLIGTDASGSQPLGNNAGLTLENSATGNLIGTSNTFAANQIGIVVQSPGNRVMGNTIGGGEGLGNHIHGIQIVTDDTVVGVQADESGLGNEILGNGGNGVQVMSGVRNRISENVIRDNGSLGIDLGNDGVTSNDDGDGDTGPNDLQNFPVLSDAGGGTLSAFVDGDAPPGSLYKFELYQALECDGSGFGEGDILKGSGGASADSNGDATAAFGGLEPGSTYTATVTDTDGNTSEFSGCLTMEGGAEVGPTPFGDVLYAVESNTDSLSIVDTTTGAITPVGRLGALGEYETPIAMAANPADGTLYVWNNSDPPAHSLASVDRCTGSATLVGSTTQQLSALAFGADGTLYGLDSDLFTVDPATGAVAHIGSFGGPRIAAADFGPDGLLYGVELPDTGTDERLFTIDTTTGALTTVATLSPDIGVIGSIVFAPDGRLLGTNIAATGTLFETDPATAAVSNQTPLSGAGPQGLGFSVACDDVPVPVTGEGIAFTAVSPGSLGGDDVPSPDGPPVFEALDFIPFEELDPLAAVRAGTEGAAEELESVGSGIAAIGSGIAAIGSGIAAIDLEAIGSGIAAIGSGIAAIDPPLSTIPLTDPADSWEARLQGTIYEGAPLQSVTLSQVHDSAPAALVGLGLGDIDYSSAAFGSLTLASVTVGNLTLGQGLGTTDHSQCAALFGSSPPANACDVTILAADVAGADLRSIGSGIAAIQLSTVDLDDQPIGTITIGAIGSGIAAIELVFDCSNPSTFDCNDPSLTLADAQNAAALRLDLLGELFLLLLPVESYDWTQMPVDALQVDVGPIARYDLSFVHQGSSSATTVDIDLPTGIHYEPGTALLVATDGSGNLVETAPPGEPAIDEFGDLEWAITTDPGVRYRLSFHGRINVVPLGVHRASATVAAGETTLSAPDAAPVTVTENLETNDTPTAAATIDDTGLYVSYLADGTDEDYFTFGIPSGDVAKVLLHHLDDDFDLLYYEPTSVTEASSRAVSEFGPTTPPLDDEGRHASDVPLDPEAADDLDLESVGSGIAAIGSGIAAIGSNRGTDGEIVEGTSDGTSVGESGIRVAGYNGASSDEAYLLQLRFLQPVDVQCAPLALTPGTPGALPTTVSPQADTLILWNAQRTEAIHGPLARADLQASIDDLVAQLATMGHTPLVVAVDGSQAVRDAYTGWDANPCSASAANAVVTAINDLVDGFGLEPPQLQSITLIGGDVLMPYERRIDLTDIANEREYGPALRNTGSGAQAGEYGALSGGWVLSNDAYAAFTSIYDWLGHRLYLPDVAIGRVVETPDEIIATLAQFVSAEGVLDPSTAVTDLDALVTGYDFLADGAEAQADALDAALGSGSTDRSLIGDTWTAAELESALEAGGDPKDVIGLGAHFDHQRLFPASTGVDLVNTADTINYETSDLLDPSFAPSLAGRVIFSVGCHSGLTVPDGIILPGGGSTTDWAQAFSRKGAVFVGNTGFGYGLDGAVGLSERLMERFATRLDGTYLMGDALASAKREHFAHQLVYGPYDEKVLAESTLFGLPFWRLVAGIAPVGDEPPGPPPDGTQSLSFGHSLVESDSGGFFATEGQSTELFNRPVQPQDVSEFLTTDGTRATGVVIRGLTSRDITPFDAVFARPIFDLGDSEPELETPGTVFPSVFAATSSRETSDGTISTVALATGQFIGEGGGVQRLFTDMSVEVLFGDVAGSAPEVLKAEAELSNPSVSFLVEVSGQADEILVLYKEAGFDVGQTQWSTLALTETSPGVWTGTAPDVAKQVEWFAQARSGSFVSTSLNKGVLFAAKLVDAGADATVVEGDIYTLSGAFIDPDNGSGHVATIDWGDGTSSQVDTFSSVPDSSALAITAAHVFTDDGVYTVEVCVTPLGDGTDCDTTHVTVLNADPVFEAAQFSATAGDAVLRAIFDDPGADDTHTATVDWGDGTVTPALVDPSTRTLFAGHTYSGVDPSTVTISVTLLDDDGGVITVGVLAGNLAPVVGPVSGPSDPVAVNTDVSVSAPFVDFDATGDYTATIDWGDGIETSGVVTSDDVPGIGTGTVTGSHAYAEAGVYVVTVTVTDGAGASGSGVFEFVVVYDPAAGFVTGAGWIASPAGAYHPDPTLTGKANFGFVSRYHRGAQIPTGNTEFRFSAADFTFRSDEYEWLVISGNRAQYKGVGDVNGEPGFRFLLTGFDADLNRNDAHVTDRFRIKVWWEDAAGDHVVYDNGCLLVDATLSCAEDFPDEETEGTTELGGGSIVIHQSRR